MYRKVRTYFLQLCAFFFVFFVYSHVIFVTFDKFCSVYDIFVRYL